MKDIIDSFSLTYKEAREKFLNVAREHSFTIETFKHPLKGVENEDLATDLAYKGPANPKRILFLNSATHGGEGFYGGANQTQFIQNKCYEDFIAQGYGVICNHAINPHGFSHARRVTEDGVDLNRNFVDFSQQLPQNPEYNDLADILVPTDWQGEKNKIASQIIAKMKKDNKGDFESAVMRGQYTHPSGLFYGGSQPTWSRETFEKIMKKYTQGVDELAIIDLHTGYGDFTEVEIFTLTEEDSDNTQRIRNACGQHAVVTSCRYPIGGTLPYYALTLPIPKIMSFAIEVGTVPNPGDTLEALRGDHYLAANPQTEPELAAKLRQDIKEAFFPSSHEWWTKASEITQKIIVSTIKELEK